MDIFCKLHLEGKTIVMVTHEIEPTEKNRKNSKNVRWYDIRRC